MAGGRFRWFTIERSQSRAAHDGISPTRAAVNFQGFILARGLRQRVEPLNFPARKKTMNGYGSTEEHQPVTWIRGHPIFAAHFVVLVFVASMLATTILAGLRLTAPLQLLSFSSASVLQGQVWRVATYGLVNMPSIWFVIDMFMIVWFGREIEKFLGRSKFLRLYLAVYLLPPIIFTVFGMMIPTAFAGETGGFALFIAFATLYPNVPVMFNVLAKWAAAVLVGIYALIYISEHNIAQLISLLTTSFFAFAYIRYQQDRFNLPQFPVRSSQPKLRVLPDVKPKVSPSPSRAATEPSMVEVDALLEKIAQSGISSLTAKERAKLDAARDDLMRKRASRE